MEDQKSIIKDQSAEYTQGANPFYKSRKLWITVACTIVAIIGFAWARISLSKTLVSEQWHRIVVASYDIEDTLARGSDKEEDLDNLRQSLVLLEREAGDVQFQSGIASGIFHTNGPRDSLADLAGRVAKYSQACADGLAAVRSRGADGRIFNELDQAKDELFEEYDDFKSSLKRDDRMPDESLKCGQFLQGLDNRYQQNIKQTAAQEEAKAAASAAEKQALELESNTVQDAVDTFVQSQIDGAPEKVEDVMTSGYAREYDFDALRGDRFINYKPIYYRINTIEKADSGNYEVTLSITYRSTFNGSDGTQDAFDQTQQLVLEVVAGPGQERWLINREIN